MICIIMAVLLFVILVLPTILPDESKLRYYSCYFTYGALTLITASFIYMVQILMSSKVPGILIMVAIYSSKIFGIEWEIRNITIQEKYKNAVKIYNHQSVMDVLANAMALRPLVEHVPVLKKELEYIFPFGQAMNLFNAAFLDRRNPEKAIMVLKEKFVGQNKSLLIAPEGTRNHKGEPFLPFKKGAFWIAVEFKKPIIPYVISPYYFLKPGKFSRGKMIVSFLEPIETSHLKKEDINDLIKKTKGLMEEEYKKLKKEVLEEMESNKAR